LRIILGCAKICLRVKIIKWLFSGAIVKNAVVKEMESCFKALFKVKADDSRDLFEENITMSSAYNRTRKSGESKDENIGDMYMLKSKGLRQLP